MQTGITFGETAIYSCNTGFTLIGDTTRNVEMFVHFWKGNANADHQNILSYHVVACMQSEE